MSRHVRSVACEPLPAFDLHFGMSRDRVNVYRRTSCWSCLWLQKQVSSPWMLNRQICNNVSISSVRFAKKEEENPPEEKLASSSPSHGEGSCLMERLACMVPTLQLCCFSILEKEYRDWSLEMISGSLIPNKDASRCEHFLLPLTSRSAFAFTLVKSTCAFSSLPTASFSRFCDQ